MFLPERSVHFPHCQLTPRISVCLLRSQAKEDENSQAQGCQCLRASQVREEFSVFSGVSDFFSPP